MQHLNQKSTRVEFFSVVSEKFSKIGPAFFVKAVITGVTAAFGSVGLSSIMTIVYLASSGVPAFDTIEDILYYNNFVIFFAFSLIMILVFMVCAPGIFSILDPVNISDSDIDRFLGQDAILNYRDRDILSKKLKKNIGSHRFFRYLLGGFLGIALVFLMAGMISLHDEGGYHIILFSFFGVFFLIWLLVLFMKPGVNLNFPEFVGDDVQEKKLFDDAIAVISEKWSNLTKSRHWPIILSSNFFVGSNFLLVFVSISPYVSKKFLKGNDAEIYMDIMMQKFIWI